MNYLIDGENLYKKQHQLATENLASDAVKSIEFYIKNHTSFDQLKPIHLCNSLKYIT
jgi:hypothetical protein